MDEDVNLELWSEAALKQGVAIQPGNVYAFEPKPVPFLRLGFTAHSEEELTAAVKTLAKALRKI